MHYNRHRYYDPNSGRFVSKDPICSGQLIGCLLLAACCLNSGENERRCFGIRGPIRDFVGGAYHEV
nr:RHS repeat-associated core domain-containing protein [Burkholderia vietnamiensis]